MLHVCSAKVCLLREPKSLHFARGILKYVFIPSVIHIGNSQIALCKQDPFAAFVIFEVLMLVRADMILPQVRKDSNLKLDAGCPVKHQALGGNFHNHAVASGFHHLRKILMDRIRLRRRIVRRDGLIPDNCLNGADQAYFVAHSLQDRLDHVCGRSLALRPGNTDDLQLFGGISEVGGGHKRQGVPGIIHVNHRKPFWRFYRAFHDHCRGPLRCYIVNIFMSV